MKIIVHPGTSTIIRADECITVDPEELNAEDSAALWSALEEGLDQEVVEIAERVGTPIGTPIETAEAEHCEHCVWDGVAYWVGGEPIAQWITCEVCDWGNE